LLHGAVGCGTRQSICIAFKLIAMSRVAFYLIATLLVLKSTTVYAQNLLPNPGFETVTTCPSGIAQMYNATGWTNPSGHAGSADFHHVCATDPWVQVPNNVFGSQSPHGGSGYMGFALFYQSTPEFREYICKQLSPVGGLTAATTYTVSFYVSAAEQSSRATDALQFYFSANAPTWGSGNWNAMTTYIPQCAIPTGTYITNKTAWVLVSATFTAAGGERFMTVGNFKTDAFTSTIANGSGSYNTGYVYFDDGIVTPSVILSADLRELKGEQSNDVIHLQWNTMNEQGNQYFEIERSAGDYNHWEYVGKVNAAGNSTEQKEYAFDDPNYMPGIVNYYRLKAVDQNGEANYSQAIGVEASPKGEHLVNLFPNPAAVGSNLQMNYTIDKAQMIHLLLVDIQGREVKSIEFDGQVGNNTLELSTSDLPSGEYLLRVQSGNLQEVRRITLL
jgi:hypothetical protein